MCILLLLFYLSSVTEKLLKSDIAIGASGNLMLAEEKFTFIKLS